MIEILWRQLPLRQYYLALSEVIGHLDVLAAGGLAHEVERDDGVVVWEKGPARATSRAAA
jgi:hypothetical protein